MLEDVLPDQVKVQVRPPPLGPQDPASVLEPLAATVKGPMQEVVLFQVSVTTAPFDSDEIPVAGSVAVACQVADETALDWHDAVPTVLLAVGD